jgi:HlyD family secretion protein
MLKKTAWMIGIATVALAIGGYVYWGGERKPPIRYKTAPVERGAIVSSVTATGTINPVVSVQVGAQVTGKIESLHADFNSVVKAGDLVARIDPSLYQARRDQASASLANAKAAVSKTAVDLAQRKRELERIKSLLAQQYVSQNDVDVALTAYEGAVAQRDVAAALVKQAEATLSAADLDLKYTVIRSPVDGIVIARNVEVGQTVTSGFQTPTLFLIALDLMHMQVDTNVSEADIGGITEGKEATFSVDAYPGERFRGGVKQVRNAPINVQNVVTYNVVIGAENADLRLKPGMTANVSIVVARKDDAVKVPNAALRFTPPKAERGSDEPQPAAGKDKPAGPKTDPSTNSGRPPRSRAGKTVWKLGASGQPETVSIQAGISDGTFTEILEGLAEGDAVIVGLDMPRGQKKSDSLPPGFGSGQRRPNPRERGL